MNGANFRLPLEGTVSGNDSQSAGGIIGCQETTGDARLFGVQVRRTNSKQPCESDEPSGQMVHGFILRGRSEGQKNIRPDESEAAAQPP